MKSQTFFNQKMYVVVYRWIENFDSIKQSYFHSVGNWAHIKFEKCICSCFTLWYRFLTRHLWIHDRYKMSVYWHTFLNWLKNYKFQLHSTIKFQFQTERDVLWTRRVIKHFLTFPSCRSWIKTNCKCTTELRENIETNCGFGLIWENIHFFASLIQTATILQLTQCTGDAKDLYSLLRFMYVEYFFSCATETH